MDHTHTHTKPYTDWDSPTHIHNKHTHTHRATMLLLEIEHNGVAIVMLCAGDDHFCTMMYPKENKCFFRYVVLFLVYVKVKSLTNMSFWVAVNRPDIWTVCSLLHSSQWVILHCHVSNRVLQWKVGQRCAALSSHNIPLLSESQMLPKQQTSVFLKCKYYS